MNNMEIIEDTSFIVSNEGDVLVIHHEEAGEIARLEGDFSAEDVEEVVEDYD
ncbi:hypothetical protein [Haloarcula sp. CBA1129]|uniref:hypothetical protein n=1 Tax=Haloarcula sp. CBA1129 TaxID=1853684 RepID=UPI001785CB29|nr:hypothetical protein [Haloarcula sp. CBA1129]